MIFFVFHRHRRHISSALGGIQRRRIGIGRNIGLLTRRRGLDGIWVYGGRLGLLAGASGEGVAVGGRRVVVLRRVCDYEHFRVGFVPLHLFPGQTPL